MKFSLLSFVILFIINNILHHVSEKVVIVIFIIFLFFLMRFVTNAINNEFKSKIQHILTDINMYMDVVFNFLYINKMFYFNLKSLNLSFLSLNKIILKRLYKTGSLAFLDNNISKNKILSI
jgi:hypothetical protein